jgi:hypothetical protein
MHRETLRIIVDPNADLPRVNVIEPLEAYITRLYTNGYTRIQLVGISILETKYLDGAEGDEFTVGVDPDVIFLLQYYLRLEELIAAGHTDFHRVYLADGCFEFSAYVSPGRAVVRAGVFRDNPFKAPWIDGTVLAAETYLAIWRSIALAISAAATLS